MKVSEYIAALRQFMEVHGDLEVETYNLDNTRVTAHAPRLAHRKVLGPREWKSEFAWEACHKGEPVCRI